MALKSQRRRRNPFGEVTALAYALPLANPGRSAADPLGLFSSRSQVGAKRPTRKGTVMIHGKSRRRARRRNVTSLASPFKKIGVTRKRRRTVWKGAGVLKSGKRTRVRRWTSVAGSAGRKASFRKYGVKGRTRRANPARKRRRSRRAAPIRRRRRSNVSRRRYTALPRKRRRSRRANPLHGRRRRVTGLRRRSRRANPGRGLRHFSRRRRNAGLGGLFGGFLKPIQQYALPALGVVGGLAIGRWGGNAIAARLPFDGPKVKPIIGSGIALVAGALLVPRIKPIPQAIRQTIVLGLAADFVARILGALLGDTGPGRFLLGWQAPSGAPAGMGRWDAYEAGLVGAQGTGAYGTQYAPIQGVGAYLQEPTEGLGAVGAYLREPQGAEGFGAESVPVFEAPAGIGAYVQEAPAGFSGFGATESMDDEDLDDVALDSHEAGVEGLGAFHAQVTNVGGRLLYATPEGAANLARTGHDVRRVKDSVRHPGATIVSAVPAGGGYQCPHCGKQGQAPSGASAFRCWSCNRAITAPRAVTNPGAQARGSVPFHTPAPSQGSGGAVGRGTPRGGIFEPLYEAAA